MKKLIILLLPVVLLCLGGCTKWISVWDNVYCVAWVQDYSWQVVYKKWDGIVLSWINTYNKYYNSDNCPVKKDEYGNCYSIWVYTGVWALDINRDYCRRPWNYDDLIRVSK